MPQPSMASSDPKRNDGDDLEDIKEGVEEEEEEEYEEIEEEIEVEEEVEVEEEEEEYEEVEEEVEEQDEEFEEVGEEEVEEEVENEGKQEAEEGVVEGKRKVGEEIAEGKLVVEDENVDDEEEEEEEYEEVEEEEYEEVEEEVEEEVTDEEEEDATMEEAEVDEKGAAEIDDVAKSDLMLPVIADGVRKDGIQDVEFEKVEERLKSGHGIAKTEAEASIVTNTCAPNVLCHDDESTLTKSNKDRKVVSSIDIGSFKSLNVLQDSNDLPYIESDVLEDNQGDVEQTMMVSTSEKDASPSLEPASDGQLGKLDPSDVKEANIHFSSSQSAEHKESRVRNRSSSPVGECEEANKRSAIICEFFAKGWCIKGSSCRFLHKKERVDNVAHVGHTFSTNSSLQLDKGKDIEMEHEEGCKLPKYDDKDKVPLLDKKDGENSSFHNDGSRAISNSFSNPNEVEVGVSNGGSMMHRNYFPRSASSMRDLGIASGDCDSILGLVEESAAMRRHYPLDFHSSVPSFHFSSWKSSSLLHRFPSSSGSEPTTSFLGSSYDFQDKLNSFQYKSTFTPYNWEPSVPFRSSYVIPPTRSSDVQYDPFRDSIEQPDVERASFKNSSYGHNQDVQRIHVHNSHELHKGLQVDSWDKTYNAHANVVPEVESAATSASDVQNKKIVEEENPMIPGSVKDILKASKSINDSSSKLQSDLQRRGEVKVENGKKPNELDDEESKAIKYFRAALVEFVKELMKPIWHEGRLSKDVYKVIVQKAEDKILSTLQPNQVPNSSESIKQYLSFSRPKILKLIQAYVDKYGKF